MPVQQYQADLSRYAMPLALRTTPHQEPLLRPKPSAVQLLASTVRAGRHETICHEGDEAGAYFRVETGCVRVSKTLPDGRRHVVDFVFAGGFFGLNDDDEYDFTVDALTDCTLTRFPRGQLEALAERDLAAANLLRRATADALAAARFRGLLLGHLSAEERLAAFLVELATRMNVSRRLPLPMARGDIGDYLGMTVETVSRTFTKFKNRGWIELRSANDVFLVDRDQLADLAEGDALAA